MAVKWSALNDAAGIVAQLAGLAPEQRTPDMHDLPALIGNSVDGPGGWRKVLAEQGIDDLAAIMEPGIAALLAIHARGVSSEAAAQALWHEFLHARSALLALVFPAGSEMLRPT